MRIVLSPSSIDDYRTFLKIKSLPRYSVRGREVTFPDEYAAKVGLKTGRKKAAKFTPPDWMFDYQRDIAEMAIEKERFAVFADCGLGKTGILMAFAHHTAAAEKKRVLIVSPLMVVPQTLAEFQRFYPDAQQPKQISAAELPDWLRSGDGIGITNYEAIRDDLPDGRLGGLILDESSMLKSHYGRWGTRLIRLGGGVRFKLCLTGTPAPNDRIEYANHAVFLGQFPTVNAFLAKYFVNRGKTDNRWELKPHALGPFYRSLSHWCIFLTNPKTYGWKDNCENIPPIHVHIEHVDLTKEQEAIVQQHTGGLFAHKIGGIVGRSALSGIAKGFYKGKKLPTLKPLYIQDRIESFRDESVIVWCLYNEEQRQLAELLPEAANISGDTPHEKRLELIDDFKAGRRRVLISKPKILGFGLNLQVATRQIFSGLQDSYESYYQAVKRSNRYGSTRPLNVHIPVTDIERPMIDTVLSKASRVQRDTEQQEEIFVRAKESGT